MVFGARLVGGAAVVVVGAAVVVVGLVGGATSIVVGVACFPDSHAVRLARIASSPRCCLRMYTTVVVGCDD